MALPGKGICGRFKGNGAMELSGSLKLYGHFTGVLQGGYTRFVWSGLGINIWASFSQNE